MEPEHIWTLAGTVLGVAALILPSLVLLMNNMEKRLENAIRAVAAKLEEHDKECQRRGLDLENRLTKLEATGGK